ncbi:MAG: tetratricopeptide repeat protein [Cyclobacteriaceae bacterium]
MKHCYLLIATILAFSCAPSKETKRDRFFMQGNHELANQNYDQAVDFYTKSIENDQNFAKAFNNRGVARLEDGHPYEAIQDYNQAILIDPQYYDAVFNRAYAYESVGKLESALNDVGFLESVYPDSAYVHFYKGLLQTSNREYQAGLQSFHRSIALDSTNMESYVNLATLCFFTDDLDSARHWLKYVLKKTPNEPNAYNTMSQIYLAEGDHQNALITINHALQIVPQEPYFLNNRGLVYLEMKDYDKALKDINKSILLNPGNAWAYRNKGIYYLTQGNYDRAIELLNDAIKRNEFIDEVFAYLGEAYLAKGNSQEACTQWARGAEVKEKRSKQLLAQHCN